jgi:hypothetical protein
VTEAPGTLSDARAAFHTKVRKGRPAHGFDGMPPPRPPRGTFEMVDVNGPVGRLRTYVSPDPKDGKRHPAVVWAHGGFGDIDSSFWDPAPRSNDQSARAFRDAGIILAVGSWRAENDNPGTMSCSMARWTTSSPYETMSPSSRMWTRTTSTWQAIAPGARWSCWLQRRAMAFERRSRSEVILSSVSRRSTIGTWESPSTPPTPKNPAPIVRTLFPIHSTSNVLLRG